MQATAESTFQCPSNGTKFGTLVSTRDSNWVIIIIIIIIIITAATITTTTSSSNSSTKMQLTLAKEGLLIFFRYYLSKNLVQELKHVKTVT